jgi:hypothetical protein
LARWLLLLRTILPPRHPLRLRADGWVNSIKGRPARFIELLRYFIFWVIAPALLTITFLYSQAVNQYWFADEPLNTSNKSITWKYSNKFIVRLKASPTPVTGHDCTQYLRKFRMLIIE